MDHPSVDAHVGGR